MTHPTLAYSVLGLVGLAGCAPIESGDASGEPVVGSLQFNDRKVELTPAAFADGPNAVPRDAIGHIIADIDLREQPKAGVDAERSKGAIFDDEGNERGRGGARLDRSR